MKLLYITIVSILFTTSIANAQHNHHHERNEIGVSTGALYGFDDKVWGMGVHMHYFRTLGEHSKWAIGGFAEQAWLDNSHFSIGAGAKFEVIEKLQLGVFPGVTFARHEHNHAEHEHDDHHHDEASKAKFSVHTELVYDLFTWDKFHMGPVVDYSWSKDDSHTMIGIHGAYCF